MYTACTGPKVDTVMAVDTLRGMAPQKGHEPVPGRVHIWMDTGILQLGGLGQMAPSMVQGKSPSRIWGKNLIKSIRS